ncbi:MAG TPA: hypothetical protein VIM35_01620 [Gallionella sp.]
MTDIVNKFMSGLTDDNGKSAALADIELMLSRVQAETEIYHLVIDKQHSDQWDEENSDDTQDAMGRDIINQYHTGHSLGLIVFNDDEQPILLMHYSKTSGWEGVNIDKRLRPQINTQIHTAPPGD